MPYLDENGIRLGGRLEFCNLSMDEKHPLILPQNSWLTTLIVCREHNKVMHGGTASTLAQVRSNYWILKGRQLVKKVIRNCFICRKYLAKPIDQLTSPLPSDRINQTPAFSVSGLDFAGPLCVNFGELQNSYIVLFTCGVTRALHLELVSDMTTNSFLLAFRRFLVRRGCCKVIYSDNAKTFLKSKKEIENLSRILSQSMVQNFIAKERIIWKNIIERSPSWGGFYERLVRSVKESLHKILGKALLSFEEMTTILNEIESVLNLRPLSYVYEENDEPRPLTPMHFLNFGQNQPTYPVTFAEILENASTKSSLLKRKKYQQLLLKQLWHRWKKQYLLDLRTAHSVKNPETHPELKVGDVVLIEENTKNKLERTLPRT
ncbi:integrase catalytic domain-containing protein [Trichonephila inaurata madagascariensis]|uniref:Integrase catalytic domain-containing protein n=1 Tax=Trichonephila inaurata madagascariensis TaxID=2747483 RepID=A0A8X7CIP2_9ARAC|nr:integrase catalytic domain-containing protein [Trichonephila inaurata madagascariensis]